MEILLPSNSPKDSEQKRNKWSVKVEENLTIETIWFLLRGLSIALHFIWKSLSLSLSLSLFLVWRWIFSTLAFIMAPLPLLSYFSCGSDSLQLQLQHRLPTTLLPMPCCYLTLMSQCQFLSLHTLAQFESVFHAWFNQLFPASVVISNSPVFH